MKNNKKIILAVAFAFSLGIIAAVGTSFCQFAAILFVPAIAPILAIGIHKLSKVIITKKANNLNNK